MFDFQDKHSERGVVQCQLLLPEDSGQCQPLQLHLRLARVNSSQVTFHSLFIWEVIQGNKENIPTLSSQTTFPDVIKSKSLLWEVALYMIIPGDTFRLIVNKFFKKTSFTSWSMNIFLQLNETEATRWYKSCAMKWWDLLRSYISVMLQYIKYMYDQIHLYLTSIEFLKLSQYLIFEMFDIIFWIFNYNLNL